MNTLQRRDHVVQPAKRNQPRSIDHRINYAYYCIITSDPPKNQRVYHRTNEQTKFRK
ncbi:hypothetical protein [Bacillus subtilis]|uniref:hypothetical protein n=1 Tax=Bacillus subtilis TaxID=1423 RepID=UPI003CF64330